MPTTLAELDYQAGEFINFIYLDERPLGWAGDFVSGLKRLFPRCRKSLDIAGSFYKNWAKATVRVRAFPLSPDLVRGMASLALLDGKPRLAASFLIAFAGLLRMGEVVQLKAAQINCLKPNLAIITFLGTASKGAQLKGQPETVLIRDPVLVQVLKTLKEKPLEDGRIFGGSYAENSAALVDLCGCFGLSHPNLTPHGFRRGGATWHFSINGSYDLTQQHGRWQDAKTAKAYIDEAMSVTGVASLPPSGVSRLAKANRVLPSLLRRHF
jgi:integrase